MENVPSLKRARTDLESPLDNSSFPTEKSNRQFSSNYYKLLKDREKLPIYDAKQSIIDQVKAHSIVLLVGETGSGKTTQVPQFLLNLGLQGMVVCTQPRRIAAISVATRVASEMDVRLGEEVGFHVRFQAMMSQDHTKLLYMTDGMLLREAQNDQKLSKYSVVIVDEAHERTIDTDISLGLLKKISSERSDFKVVVMSATLDMEKFQSFFLGAPLLKVSGRVHPVTIDYLPEQQKRGDFVDMCVECVCRIHETLPAGDILCFLTGEAEIERAVQSTKARLSGIVMCDSEEASVDASTHSSAAIGVNDVKPTQAVVLPLFGSLSLPDQKKVFQVFNSETRKIIYSTNIAETSLTIDGIVYVVDSGFQKQSLYNSASRIDYLLPSLISKASAEQRKGRAGRTREGKCFRLYSMKEYAEFPDQTHPEVLRTNVLNTVLLLLSLGVENPCLFPFLDTPSQQSFMDAFYQLSFFGAIDEDLNITPFGKKMAELPVDACLSRMLLMSETHKCGADVAVVAAMLEAGPVFLRPPSRTQDADNAKVAFENADGDHLTLFNVFHGFWKNQNSPTYCYNNFLKHTTLQQAVKIYGQIRGLMGRMNIRVESTYDGTTGKFSDGGASLRRAILEGFFTQVAYLAPGSDKYKTVNEGILVSLHKQSVLQKHTKPTWIVYDGLEIQGPDGAFVRLASEIEVSWLFSVSSYFMDLTEVCDSDLALVLQREKEKSIEA